jgi:hypothetical protein
MVELYLHSPTRLHGVVLNYLRADTTLSTTWSALESGSAGRYGGHVLDFTTPGSEGQCA